MSRSGPILSLVGGVLSVLVASLVAHIRFIGFILTGRTVLIFLGIIFFSNYIFSFVSIVGGILGITEKKTGPTICIISGIILILCIILDIAICALGQYVIETSGPPVLSLWGAIFRAILGIPPAILVLVGGIIGKKRYK